MYVVCDIETDRLFDPTKIWLIVCKEVETGIVHEFRWPDHEGFKEFAAEVSRWIMHNGIHFDARHISNFLVHIDSNAVIDTLVLSRLIDYQREGGHSLDSWGERLGYPKLDFKDFSELTEEMVTYCHRDVEITYQLWVNYLKSYWLDKSWSKAISLEHRCAVLGEEMSANGFPFDIKTALELTDYLTEKLEILDKEIKRAFKPKSVLVREITPITTKHGTLHKKDFRWAVTPDGSMDLTAYSAGCPFSLIKFEEFNPGSVKQIVARMNEAGWSPVEKTKKHKEVERELRMCRSRIKRAELQEKLSELTMVGWKVSEKNLETLPDTAPEEAKKLTERLITARRLSTLKEWSNAYREVTRRIHGTFNTIGCWTHRFSHVAPNFANIVSVEKSYGKQMRGLWRVEKDQYLIDVDAEGIQLRVLAHYMNDPVFIKALCQGKEEDETDIHNVNRKALQPVKVTRKQAKAFIYSWLLGAGIDGTAAILKCPRQEAKKSRDNFLETYPGLKHLREVEIPRDADRGYFIGFDGRKVPCNSTHLMLSGYLQNGEAIVMKTAWIIADRILKARKLPFKWINHVHDEYLVTVPRCLDVAIRCLDVMKFAIKRAGEVLNLRCPMAGKGTWGNNWGEIH